MRVWSVNQNYQQNYKKQNIPSFQATGTLISREIKGDKMQAVAKELFDALVEGNFHALGRTAIAEKMGNIELPDHIVINTPVDYDDAVITLVENFAKKHGFDCKIFSDESRTYESMEAHGHRQALEYQRTGHF